MGTNLPLNRRTNHRSGDGGTLYMNQVNSTQASQDAGAASPWEAATPAVEATRFDAGGHALPYGPWVR